MVLYEQRRRNLNFQRRAQIYAYANYAFRHMNNKIGSRKWYNAKNLPGKQYSFSQFRNFLTNPTLTIINRNKARAELAAYKAKLNSNALLYKHAGKSVKYSPNRKRYVAGFPGMTAKFAEILADLRRSQTTASKYGKAWMEKSGVLNRRANAAAAAKANENEAARKAAQANYNKILANDKTRTGMNKVRYYAKLWLNKNLTANSTYKTIALNIHPDKGKRNHANDQAKRTALFKLLSTLK